jgi:glycosyltransferase involved in cell wall biosynthesis
LPGIYAQADIKVISSEYESFCFAAIEAMASGLPVVTTDCGWVPGLIGDTLPPIEKQWVDSRGEPTGRFENDTPGHRIREAPGGLVVGREHAEGLAQAMLTMASDAALRERCGTWNRDKAVRDHGWESSAKKLEEVYERVIQDSGFEISGP